MKQVADKRRRRPHTGVMPSPLSTPGPVIVAAACGLLLLWSACAGAQTAAARPASAATEALQSCERAARQSLATKGTPAAELKFSAALTEQPGLSNDGRIVLQGAGSWRDGAVMRRFDYSCNVDPRAPEAVGLVMRDTTPAAAEARPPRPEIEPDLSHLSPTACESGAAAALKKRWPLVSEISFDTSTRRLSQESPSRAELHGRGRALPAPGAPIVFFGFDCQVDPRDGRVLNTGLSG
jgi:hypothetical protein